MYVIKNEAYDCKTYPMIHGQCMHCSEADFKTCGGLECADCGHLIDPNDTSAHADCEGNAESLPHKKKPRMYESEKEQGIESII